MPLIDAPSLGLPLGIYTSKSNSSNFLSSESTQIPATVNFPGIDKESLIVFLSSKKSKSSFN